MKFCPINQWISRSEFGRVCRAVHNGVGSLQFMAANLWRCKYIQFRIDQRTGSFLMLDGEGKVLTKAEIYRMFPELVDEGEEVPVDL